MSMQLIQNQTLYQMTFLPRLFPVNCYFVEEENDLTLIDTAFSFSAKGILDTAARIGKRISRIVVTHAHVDHIGSLDKLRQALPEALVYISARDARLLEGDLSPDPHEPESRVKFAPRPIATRPDFHLKEGDRIGSLLAISTPGHTPGSMSLIDTRNLFAIVGDALQTLGGFAITGQLRPLFPFPSLGTWNKQIAIESARKLRAYKPALLAAGHGRMLANPLHHLDRAIKQGAERSIKE